MIAKVTLAILMLAISTPNYAYIVDGLRLNQPKLLSFAKNKLQNQGTLRQAKDGSTYLQIADRYTSELIRQAARPGFELPKERPSISVIRESETPNVKALQELGQTVKFKPIGFYTVVQHDKEYLMMAVEAPELDALRKKYGLSAQPDNHAFNITIGVRQLVAENELVSP